MRHSVAALLCCITEDLRDPAPGLCWARARAILAWRFALSGISPHMKRRAAKSERKPSRRPQPKSLRLQTGKRAGAEAAKASRLPSRAVVMRLAAEVDALA